MTAKRIALAALLALTLLALTPAPGQAWHHWHGGVYVGVSPWFWDPYWWYPPPPYYRYPYGYPPPAVADQPMVYVERPATLPPGYWYYCSSAQAYYPSAPQCPEPWIPVPPRSE